MSPFKSDLDAAFARAEAAEKENEKLRAEIAALKNPPPPTKNNNLYESSTIGVLVHKPRKKSREKIATKKNSADTSDKYFNWAFLTLYIFFVIFVLYFSYALILLAYRYFM